MAGEERFYYSVQEFLRIFFAYGFKKNVHPHECAKPNAPPKKNPNGLGRCCSGASFRKLLGWRWGKKNGGSRSLIVFMHMHIGKTGEYFFVSEIYHSVSEIF